MADIFSTGNSSFKLLLVGRRQKKFKGAKEKQSSACYLDKPCCDRPSQFLFRNGTRKHETFVLLQCAPCIKLVSKSP